MTQETVTALTGLTSASGEAYPILLPWVEDAEAFGTFQYHRHIQLRSILQAATRQRDQREEHPNAKR